MKQLELMSLLGGTLTAASGQVLLKIGASGKSRLIDFINVPIIAGLSLYVLGAILWIYALSKLPLTIVYPFTALTFCFVYVIAIIFLNEPFRWSSGVGMLLVLSGLYLVVQT